MASIASTARPQTRSVQMRQIWECQKGKDCPIPGLERIIVTFTGKDDQGRDFIHYNSLYYDKSLRIFRRRDTEKPVPRMTFAVLWEHYIRIVDSLRLYNALHRIRLSTRDKKQDADSKAKEILGVLKTMNESDVRLSK